VLILKLLEAPKQTQWSPGSKFTVAPNGPQVLGRGPKSDLKFDHPSVSVDHAQFINKDKAWFVEDLGSRDGTRINGRRLQARSPSFCEQRMLGDGDRLFRRRA